MAKFLSESELNSDISKSLPSDDFDFFKLFPNIEIRYEGRLHAKFYANEKVQILSTMNLYDSSQNNNIEAGVKTEHNLLRRITNNLVSDEKDFDIEACKYFEGVIENSELLFKNVPEIDSRFLSKKLKGIKTETDKISHIYSKIDLKSNASLSQEVGYCIRSGIEIPFNPRKPFSTEAFQIWAQYKDRDYPEKYCHRTGKPSKGKTSMTKPILYKN